MEQVSSKILGAEHLTEVISSLQNADRLVRQGSIELALKEIMKAREKNPTIMYARAYEEYIRSILLKQHERSEQGGLASEEQQNVINVFLPTLEKILDIAIKEVKRSAASAYKEKMVISLKKKRDDEIKKEEEIRVASLRQKITTYINRAKNYQSRNDFHSALNEIARAFMLNPTDERILTVEEEIRALQEEYKTREQAELDRQFNEDKTRREKLFDEWNTQRHKEREIKKKKEDEEIKLARGNKIREYLQGVRKFFAEGNLENAISELAFVLVLDPLSEEVLSLNIQLRDEQKRRHQATLEQKQRAREEDRIRREAIKKGIQKNLRRAEQYVEQKRFSDALRIITQAYFIDPTDNDIIECENRIIVAEEEHTRLQEVERKRHEDAQLRKQEAELHRIAIAQQKREQLREKNELEALRLREQEEILLHVSKARGFYAQSRFDEALAHIAQAFKLNPLNQEIVHLQEEIIETQKKQKLAKRENFDTLLSNEKEYISETFESQIAEFIEKAKVYRADHLYQQALDEIAQAYGIDPTNEVLFALEGEIQQEFLKYEEQQQLEHDQSEKANAIKKSLAMAREAMSKESYSEAMAWVDYAMSLDMYHPETMDVRTEIEKAMRYEEDRKANEDKELVIQFHLSRAMEFFAEQRISEATLEIDLALRLNSKHNDALQLKERVKNAYTEVKLV